MANSYLNILTFLLSTIFYYLALKPSLTYELNANKNTKDYTNYISKSNMHLAIYVLIVLLIQFIVNSANLSSMPSLLT